jgi:hypothetical protein
MSPHSILLSSLVLFETLTFPLVGPVTRTSLLGYRLDLAGDVLDLQEAAARVDAMGATPKAPPCPGLVRLAEPLVTVAPEVTKLPMVTAEPVVTMVTTPPGEPSPSLPVGKAEPMATYGHLDGPAERLVELDADEEQLFTHAAARASERRAVGADVDGEGDEIQPDGARAVLCDVCKGGARHQRNGCPRCDGRCIRVWCNNREISPLARPRTDQEALGVVCALSRIFGELEDDRQRAGARSLFDVATRRPSKALRRQALAQWTPASQTAIASGRA